jgi:RHS repeat-associated protein
MKILALKPRLLPLLLLILFSLAFDSATAATVTWIGGSGDWADATNWSNGTLPGQEDDVVIDPPAGTIVTHATGSHAVKSLLSQKAFSLSGGTLKISGTVQVNDVFSLSGGTLSSATVLEGVGEKSTVTVSSYFSLATFDGVTFASDVHHESGRLNIINGLTLSAGAKIYTTGIYFRPGTQRVDGEGEIVLNGYMVIGNLGSMTLTLGSGITVRGEGIIGCEAASSLINKGIITAEGTGETLQISIGNPGSGNFALENEGTLGASSGGILTLQLPGSWKNTGTIVIDNSTLRLMGNYTQSDLGKISRTGGTIESYGILTGGLELNATTGSWTLSAAGGGNSGGSVIQGGVKIAAGGSLILEGGAIQGGVVTISPDAALYASPRGGTISGATVNGDIQLAEDFSYVTISGGLVLNGRILLTAGGSIIASGTQTFSTATGGSIEFQVTNRNSSGRLATGPLGSTLTLAPGFVIRGNEGSIGNYDGVIVNQGLIIADGNAEGYNLQLSSSFRNEGSIEAINGGDLYINAQNWTNVGTIAVTNSVLELGGGVKTADLGTINRSGGTIKLRGTLNNNGTSLNLDSSTGPWILDDGTIQGGTVNISPEIEFFSRGGTLFGVTVNGNLQLAENSSRITIKGGLVLNGGILMEGSGCQVLVSGTQTFSTETGGQIALKIGELPFYASSIDFAGPVSPDTTLTLSPGFLIREGPGSVGESIHIGGSGDIINKGKLSVATSGSLAAGSSQRPFQNQGILEAINGGSLTVFGSASIPVQGGFISDNSSAISINGSLLGNTTNPQTFAPRGTTRLGGGTAASPVFLEAMSEDLGATPAGFNGKFVYGTLTIGSDAHVQLVNQFNNSGAALVEALYANSVIVSPGATLDLNGLHLYTRAAQFGGALANGTITQLPDSGPLALNTMTPGAISVPGELDEWTFFGRAGKSVTVVVNTGSGNVLSPRLNYAEVQLLDPSTNLLILASNSVPGQVVALTDVALPTDGIYRIHIRAPSNQSGSSGNYQVTLWDDTADVSSLLLNQQVNGRIETPYSVDRWTFSAVAGKQIRFDLINASAPGIAFTLRGPNGWIGFTNILNDSGLVTLPESGGYTLTAFGTGGTYNIAYAFRLIQTEQANLTLGTTFTGNFAGTDQAQLFAVVVTNGGPLRVVLNNAGPNNVTELYVKLGSPPTRGEFDFRSANPNSSSQQLLIPYAVPGTYYVLVYGSLISTPGSYTVGASSTSVLLTGSIPDRNANNVALKMTLTGAGFGAGTTVELIAASGTSYSAASVSVDSFTQLTATFPPNLAPAGIYSVRVLRAGGGTGTLSNVFTFSPAGAAKLETRLIMPGALGRHATATLYVEYANTGDAAMPAPLLVLKSSDPDGSDRPILTLDQSRLIQNYWSAGLPPGAANQIFILASGAQPGILNPGESFQVPVYYLGLQQPWDFSDNQVEMEIRFWTADDPSPIDWSTRKESLRPPTLEPAIWDVVYANLTSGLTNTAAYVQMLSDNAQFLARLGQRVVDVDELWNFEVQQAYGYTPIPVLDSSVDASLPAPGVTLNLQRRFSTNLRARNSTGLFGRGWYTPWQATLIAESGGDLVKIVGEAGSARLFTRDTRTGGYFSGRGDSSHLISIGGGVYELRDQNGISTWFRADGKIDYVEDPNDNRVTAGYNAENRLAMLSHTSGAFITLGYNSSGLLQTVTDSAGRSVTYGYDSSNTYLQTATTDDNKITSYTYETAGTLGQRHALTSITRGGTTRHFTFDGRGRLEKTYLADNEQWIHVGYDSMGGVTVADAQGTTFLYFDQFGLLRKVTDPLGNITTSEFNDDLRLSRIVTPTGESKSFTWCDCGSLTGFTDELGHTTSFTYDNAFKRLTSFTDARHNMTTYAYNANGNLLSTTYPNNSVERFGSYTPSGLPQLYTNRRNHGISYRYTTSGQVDRQTFGDGSYADFDYDGRGNLLTVTEHPVSGPDKITAYTYANATDGNRLRKVTYPNARWVEFFYDSFGRRRRMTDSTGQTNNYDYDAAGRLWKVRDATNGVLVEYLYFPSGRLQRINKGNGTYTTYDYDPAGQLLHLTNSAPDGSVNSRFGYSYDNRGGRRMMSTADGNWTYNYDGSGQLTRAVFLSGNLAILNQDLLFNYDETGNRISTTSNGSTTNYMPNNLNQYRSVGDTALQYDPDGNLTFDGLRHYFYDERNYLIRTSGPEGVTEYEYDAIGNRSATVFNGERTEYLLDPTGLVNVLAELDASGDVAVRYIQGRGVILMERRIGPRFFYDFDAIGGTSTLTDDSGRAVNRYSYLPFGGSLSASETVPNSLQFIGQLGIIHEENGLHFMRARFFSASSGSFTSIDPIRLSAGDLNFYRYVGNSPTRFVDPLGLQEGLLPQFVIPPETFDVPNFPLENLPKVPPGLDRPDIPHPEIPHGHDGCGEDGEYNPYRDYVNNMKNKT